MRDVPKMGLTSSWSRVLPEGEKPDFQDSLVQLHSGHFQDEVHEEQMSLFAEKNAG